MAPIAASSQTRSKLKAFQYEQHDPPFPQSKVVDDNKENSGPNEEERGSQMDPPRQPLSQRSANDVRDCPQTPLGKLPLSQLIASGEDPRQHLKFTPIERVLWDNTPFEPDPLDSMQARKRRKRAHSSSPASSSQNETSNYFKRQTAEVQALQQALKTPKADPAGDLWNRYSMHTGNDGSRSPTAPAGLGPIQLLHSSSPQTPASNIQKDSGGLRRALSNIEWSTSAAKRRKLFHNRQRNSTMGVSNIQAEGSGQSKMSKVSMLIEKIHDGLLKPVVPPRKDSSSDPGVSSPTHRIEDPPSSPREENVSNGESQREIDGVANVLSQTSVVAWGEVTKPLILSNEYIAELEREESSDFDDDELDIDMMESIDATCEADPPLKQKNNRMTSYKEPQVQSGDQQDKPSKDSNPTSVSKDEKDPLPIEDSLPAGKRTVVTHDEFDDDENDLFAADLEDVCARYDSQAQPKMTWQSSPPTGVSESMGAPKKVSPLGKEMKPVAYEVLSDEDDFGGDSDFEQIAAECAENTQKQQVPRPQSSVRF